MTKQICHNGTIYAKQRQISDWANLGKFLKATDNSTEYKSW